MSGTPLRVWRERDGHLARLRLSRPKANIVDAAMTAALDAAFAEAAGEPRLRGLLLDAEGPNFSFGASVEEHLPATVEAMLRGLHALLLRMLAFPVPTLVAIRGVIAQIRVSDAIVDYIVDLVRATRERPAIAYGASPRAATMLAMACRAYAAMQGRDFVLPDDIKALAVPALRHRVVLAPGAEVEGMTADAVIRRVVEEVEAPR